MRFRSLPVISALLTLFYVGIVAAPVVARSRRTPGPGMSADDEDEDDDDGDEEIDSTTVSGNRKGRVGVGSDTDVDELIFAPVHQKPVGPRDPTDGLPESQEDSR